MKNRILAILACAMFAPAMPAPVQADEAVGSYLAARQARYDNDFAAAAEYYTRALTEDPSNSSVFESAIIAHLALGQFDSALPIARKVEADGVRSQVAHMALIADEVQRDAFEEILTRLENDRGVSELADSLLTAWALRGNGDMKAALEKFDEIGQERGVRGFVHYHKALALASVGDFENAERIFSEEDQGPMQRTRAGVLAWAEILSQLNRNDDAVAMIDEILGANLNPEMRDLRDRLAAGEQLPFTRIRSAKDGIAEVFYTLGQALLQDTSEDYVLLYARIAEFLRPDHVDATIMSAELLEELGQYDLANETYKRVPRDHMSFHAAELGRAESLRRAGKTDAAIEVLTQLAKSHPDLPVVHVSTGDLYRQLEQFDQAVAAYDTALEIYSERENDQWFVHYARGISHERLGNWENAETDFRRALELNPGQPEVLNYLGYSLVEKESNLDEALEMIEAAAEARPDSGYIIDSLGWALFRLGRYDEAIGHMEHAAELMPVDPVVNDHLGDVLWAVGRHTEARFQWKRALSFVDNDNPSPDVEPDRIRRKLEIGLDQVLSQEGSEPLKVADDNG